MNVETTPELILAAAAKCPQAKEALKTLFPKVFDHDLSFNEDATGLLHDQTYYQMLGVANGIAEICGRKDLCNKSIWLDNRKYKWEIIKGDNNYSLLIPTRK